jgi:hypothetical protein
LVKGREPRRARMEVRPSGLVPALGDSEPSSIRSDASALRPRPRPSPPRHASSRSGV